MNSIELVEPVTDKDKVKRKHCFKLVTPGRIFLIAAENVADMESWMVLIKQAKEDKINSGAMTNGVDSLVAKLFSHIPHGPPELEVPVKSCCSSFSQLQLNGKSVEELEEMLNGLEDAMKTDINRLVDHCLQEKDHILDELMRREIQLAEKKMEAEKAQLEEELQRRA